VLAPTIATGRLLADAQGARPETRFSTSRTVDRPQLRGPQERHQRAARRHEGAALGRSLVDPARIGLAGHSLGGYNGAGLAGGWESWKRSDIKAVLARHLYRAVIRHGAPRTASSRVNVSGPAPAICS